MYNSLNLWNKIYSSSVLKIIKNAPIVNYTKDVTSKDNTPTTHLIAINKFETLSGEPTIDSSMKSYNNSSKVSDILHVTNATIIVDAIFPILLSIINLLYLYHKSQ